MDVSSEASQGQATAPQEDETAKPEAPSDVSYCTQQERNKEAKFFQFP